MNELHPKTLIDDARRALSDPRCNPHRLAFLHAAVAAGASLLVTVLSFLLSTGIGNTGGLSGMNSRALLETAQSVIQLFVSLLSPFWALGFMALALQLCRHREAGRDTLTLGLRRFGPALRLLILQALIYFAVTMAAVQLGALLFSLSPVATQLQAALETVTAADGTVSLDMLLAQLDLRYLLLGTLPFILIPLALLLIPVAYRLRLANYILMDDDRCGALAALMGSLRLTRGHCLRLFRLDLHYWWYYVLEALVLVLAYGDAVLDALGVTLNMSATTASFIFLVLALLAQTALYAWKKPQVFTTYALLYDRLRSQPREQI